MKTTIKANSAPRNLAYLPLPAENCLAQEERKVFLVRLIRKGLKLLPDDFMFFNIKEILLSAFLLVSFSNLIAQNSFKFSHVLEVPGVPKEDLYVRAYLWALEQETLTSLKIIESSFDLGFLYLSGEFLYSADESEYEHAQISGFIAYQLWIFVRDEHFKYMIKDFYHTGSKVVGGTPHTYGPLTTDKNAPMALVRKPKEDVWNDIKNEANARTGDLAKGLLLTLSSPTELEMEW